jgi:hypothetical protein
VPAEITFRPEPDRVVRLTYLRGAWRAAEERLAWRTDTVSASTAVQSTLFAAVHSALATHLPRPERSEIVYKLGDIFEYRVDVGEEVGRGDSVRLVVERRVDPEGTPSEAKILAASLTAGGKRIEAFRFRSGRTSADYFDWRRQVAARGVPPRAPGVPARVERLRDAQPPDPRRVEDAHRHRLRRVGGHARARGGRRGRDLRGPEGRVWQRARGAAPQWLREPLRASAGLRARRAGRRRGGHGQDRRLRGRDRARDGAAPALRDARRRRTARPAGDAAEDRRRPAPAPGARGAGRAPDAPARPARGAGCRPDGVGDGRRAAQVAMARPAADR